jgi:hypothetical protein
MFEAQDQPKNGSGTCRRFDSFHRLSCPVLLPERKEVQKNAVAPMESKADASLQNKPALRQTSKLPRSPCCTRGQLVGTICTRGHFMGPAEQQLPDSLIGNKEPSYPARRTYGSNHGQVMGIVTLLLLLLLLVVVIFVVSFSELKVNWQ